MCPRDAAVDHGATNQMYTLQPFGIHIKYVHIFFSPIFWSFFPDISRWFGTGSQVRFMVRAIFFAVVPTQC